jgi:glycopeptide antibiotics resistance protein
MLLLIAGEFSKDLNISPLMKLGVCTLATILLLLATTFRVRSLASETQKQTTARVTLWILFGIYCAYAIVLLFFQNRSAMGSLSLTQIQQYALGHSNFVLTDTISKYTNDVLFNARLPQEIRAARRQMALTNLFGNLIAFAPTGFFIPLLFPPLQKVAHFILTIFLTLLLIESAQIVFMTGSFDIDDIFLNALGAIFVFFLFRTPKAQETQHHVWAIAKQAE